MRTVEVDDEVYATVQRQAIPLEDTFNTVLRRLLQAQASAPERGGGHSTGDQPEVEPNTTATTIHQSLAALHQPTERRMKLDHRELLRLGVSHFEVDGQIPEYRSARAKKGETAHERAYLDACLDAGKTTVPYFQRWKERDLPNPRGDAASRVILRVGLDDQSSKVHFLDGRELVVSEFIGAYVQGNLLAVRP